MACFVAISFASCSLFVSHTELQSNKSTKFAVSTPRFTRASFRVSSSSCTSKYTTTQDLHLTCHIGVFSRNLSNVAPFLSEKNYCPRTLSGYWVGPDSEDGWGFIEALVDEII